MFAIAIIDIVVDSFCFSKNVDMHVCQLAYHASVYLSACSSA